MSSKSQQKKIIKTVQEKQTRPLKTRRAKTTADSLPVSPVASTGNTAKRQQRQSTICLDDLTSGRRAVITEVEYAQLKGCSRFKFQRDRYQGKGTPFQRDEGGRIWYAAFDVLKDLQRKSHRSTNEYDTSDQVARLEKARAAQQEINI
jgi:hypothetical protein